MSEQEKIVNELTPEVEEEKRTKIGTFFNRFFHYYERGSNMKKEILGGLSMFLVSICALFLNMSVLSDAFSSDVPYLGLYLASTIISFIGTLVIGLIANLPLTQTASLTISSVFISMIGANSGLSYYNLLVVTFFCAIIYTILMSIPIVRRKIYEALPSGVRKALPVALGLLVAGLALNHIGVVDLVLNPSSISSDTRPTYAYFCIIMGVIGLIVTALYKLAKAKHPFLYGFVTTTILFFFVAAVSGTDGEIFSAVFSTNRAWIGINPDANGEMYSITEAFSQLHFGEVFTSGFDFSSFTEAGGDVFFLFVEGILVFLFMGMYESEAGIRMADENGQILIDENSDKRVRRALLVNSATNVIAPLFSIAPVTVSKESSLASGDGAKTGLASVVASIGYLIMMFQWVVFIFFATYVPVVPEYGHAGYVFSTVVDSTFQIAASVIFVLSLCSLKAVKKVDFSDAKEFVPFLITVVFTLFLQNIAFGVALGVVSYVVIKLFSFKKEEIKSITLPTSILSIISLLTALFIF